MDKQRENGVLVIAVRIVAGIRLRDLTPARKQIVQTLDNAQSAEGG